MKGSTIGGIVVLVVLGAILADLLAHKSGTSSLFSGTNSILTSGYKAASGSYA